MTDIKTKIPKKKTKVLHILGHLSPTAFEFEKTNAFKTPKTPLVFQGADPYAVASWGQLSGEKGHPRTPSY